MTLVEDRGGDPGDRTVAGGVLETSALHPAAGSHFAGQEIKRRSSVVRIIPDEAARLRLVCALAMEVNAEWMEEVYLKMGETSVVEEVTVGIA